MIRIDQPNVLFEGASGVTLRPANASADAFEIAANGVAVQNFTLETNGTTRFNDGILVEHHVDNVSIQNVTIDGATVNAGLQLSSTGSGTCVADATVSNTGGDGVIVRVPPTPTPGGGTIVFRNVTADNNAADGFAMRHPNNSVGHATSVTFLSTIASGNDGDGYDLDAATMEILCSSSIANTGTTTNRGIVTFNARPVLHIENAHVRDNSGIGIVSDAAITRIIGSTVVDNEVYPTPIPFRQISANRSPQGDLYVYNTLARGSLFIDGNADLHCGHNLYTDSSGGCSGTQDDPIFQSASQKSYLAANSPGLDAIAVDPSTISEIAGVIQVADGQDRNGGNRPEDGNGDGNATYDVGAFERSPSATPRPTTAGPTATRTRTPTWTKTPPPSHTPTRRFTRTLGPSRTPTPTPLSCPSTPCPNGCGGDCNCGGTVSVNELVFGVNNVLDRVDPPCNTCFDADLSGSIMVNDLVAAVNNNLRGCPTAPTPTPQGGTGQGGLEIAVSVGSASGLPGASVSVPISVAGGWGFVAAMQVDLIYSASVVEPYFHCEPSSRLGGGQSVAASLIPAPAGNRRLRVILVPSFSAIATFTDGEVAVCTFDLSETAPPGGSTIQVHQPGSSDPWGNAFATSATAGSICVIGGCGCQ